MRFCLNKAVFETISDETGSAMFEFVAIMPLFALIMVLAINFGNGFLKKQKAIIAARYVVTTKIRMEQRNETFNKESMTNYISRTFFRGQQTRIVLAEDSNARSTITKANTRSQINSNEIMNWLMDRVEGRASAEVGHIFKPFIFKETEATGKYYVTIDDWRYAETKSFIGLVISKIGNALGWLGRMIF